MMVARLSTGMKVVFEEMKSLVQLEIFRRISSKLACFHKRILVDAADGRLVAGVAE